MNTDIPARAKMLLALPRILVALVSVTSTLIATGGAALGADSFAATGPMSTPRGLYFTATGLANGKVLIVGGWSPGDVKLASAELYHPTTGTFTPTGSMAFGRAGHRATLLPNGKVLITGGTGGTPGVVGGLQLSSAELYDPASGTFTATGPMNRARMGHTATLLDNGKVLVTGGAQEYNNTWAAATAELYDPSTGAFTFTGPMGQARLGHTAALLPNGKVLVATGCSTACNNPVPSAELYEPTTGAFSPTGSMATPRQGYPFGAVLLANGKVLIAGGNTSGFGVTSSAELYDPATGTFSTTGAMSTPRTWVETTLLASGRVLATGGTPGPYTLNSAEVYDPGTQAWAPTEPMTVPRYAHTATLLSNGRVLVVGGANEAASALASAELYTPADADVTARAGADQSVNEGDSVALDGSASSGQDLNYAWTQLAGPEVQLSDPTSATPSFIAPALPGGFGSRTLTFQLTVQSGAATSTDTVDVTVSNVNHDPVADPGADLVVNEGSPVALNGTASYDPDGDSITFQWTQTAGPEVGLTGADTASPSFTAPLLGGGLGGGIALTFELTVSDGALSHTDSVTVGVEQVNHAPVADAGAPQTVHSGTTVTLNGSASADPDSDPLSYSWTQVSGPTVALAGADTASPSFVAPPLSGSASLVFDLTVSDSKLSSAAQVTVTVENGGPRCELARPDPALLWPPNHGMRQVRITNVTDPNNDQVAITITGVAQDEATNGLGDGDTSPDAVLQGSAVLLRAERAGTGDGRVYRVAFTADDGVGGACAGSVQVTVPKSMKPGQPVGDQGPTYDSTMP